MVYSNEDFLENYLFCRHLSDAITGLKAAHPGIKIVASTVDNLYIPSGIVACDGDGEGECEVRKRVSYHKLVTNADDTLILEIHLHEYWTSSCSTAETDNGLMFWDEEKDVEVFVDVPVAEV